jgi:hypothetical protein
MNMLMEAREAALRDRDALMSAITSEDHKALAALLRKLLPAVDAHPEAGIDAEGKATSGGLATDPVVQDLRLLGNQIRSKELSQDEALKQMLESLLRWRGILTERAIEAARAEKAERAARGYESERFQGYVRMSLSKSSLTVDELQTVGVSMIKSSGHCNTDYKRRYFVLRDGWLRFVYTCVCVCVHTHAYVCACVCLCLVCCVCACV